MKPAIIHAAGFAAPYGGNFIASLCALEVNCKNQGWNFILALPAAAAKKDWCTRLIAEGYQVYFLTNKASVLRYTWELAGIALSTNAVLIHTHFTLYDVAAWAASCLLRLRRKELHVIWHVHSEFPVRMTPIRRAKDLLKYRVMGRTVNIIAVSEHLRQQIIEAGFNAAAIQTLLNGIDLDRVSTATRSRAEICKDLNIPPQKKLLLLFGWEPTIKGVDVAMDAVEKLIDLDLPVVLGIVGTEALQEFVMHRTNRTLPSWLHILPPTDNVADLYQGASVFLSASRSEGFPYSICEAMVNSLPVVLSDLPGVSWARKAPGALFFPSGNSAALAQAIREVLNWTAEERAQNTNTNKQLVCKEFSVSTWVDRIIRLYREVLGQDKHTSP